MTLLNEIIGIAEVFDLAQQSSACHLKLALSLKNNLENNHEEFFTQLCKYLQYVFTANYKENNIFVIRIIDFIATLASLLKSNYEADSVEINPILMKIFDFLLKLSNSANDSHRYWSSVVFNKIFKDLEEITEDLFEKVKGSLLDRLQDPKAAIRCQAVTALHRLQDPSEDSDEIIREFCEILNSDINAKVRQLCLEKIALNKRVIPYVLNRLLDVDTNVRMTGFEKISLIPKYLKISERRLVLHSGFFDLSEKIKSYVSSKLLKIWLENYDNNYLNLMKAIRLDACEEDIFGTATFCELMLNALFKLATLEEILNVLLKNNKLMSCEKLNWETSLFFRVAVQYLRQCEDFEPHLLKILPELVDFCGYIKEFTKLKKNYDDLQYHFILQQLFLITEGFDVSDSVSRQSLNILVHDILRDEILPPNTAEIIVRNLEKTRPRVNDLSNFICELVSNLLYGEETEYEELRKKEEEKLLQISQLQAEIHSLSDAEKHFVYVEKNFSEAEIVKNQIEEKHKTLEDLKKVQDVPQESQKKRDFETISRCLTITEAFLRLPSVKQMNPFIATLNTEVINEALMYDDDRIKIMALKCYALLCVIDETIARYGIHLFSGLIFTAESEVEVLTTSINVITDILTIYGLNLVERIDEEDQSDSRREDEKKVFVGGTSLTDLLQALADYLDHEDFEVQIVATRGICSLLLNSRIISSSLFSRMIIKWANPATDCERVKQFIGLTLNDLVKFSNCHLYFTDAVVSTIRTIVYAPKGSPLNDIDLDNITKFMVTLCRLTNKSEEIQTELALKICHLMFEKPKAKINLLFSKTLILLTVPPGEHQVELFAICDDLKDVIRDRQILRNINKFTGNFIRNNLAPIEEGAIEE